LNLSHTEYVRTVRYIQCDKNEVPLSNTITTNKSRAHFPFPRTDLNTSSAGPRLVSASDAQWFSADWTLITLPTGVNGTNERLQLATANEVTEPMGNLVYGRTILKQILKKEQNTMVLNTFMWVRIRTSSALLWTGQ
jgi:hypothetical protein